MKRKLVKKLTSVLSMVLLFTMLLGVGSVFADETQQEEPRYVPDAIVLTIYAAEQVGSSLPNMSFGHSYITIENFCKKPITVGKLSIADGTSVSLGTWNDDDEHEGIYYNRELMLDDNVYHSYSKTITEAQLAKLSTFVRNSSNNDWQVTKTCTNFAIGAWRSTGLGIFSQTSLPAALKSQIKYQSGYGYGRSLPQDYPVYYVDSTGSLAYSSRN